MNRTPILFLNVLVIAACGLMYGLLAGTVASYVSGDSVTQFSLIIGLYLSALGVGAWLSRYLDRDLAARFIEVELAVALIGGLSAPLLFFGFARLQWFQLFLFLIVFVIGVLVGLELPILMRILREQLDFKELVSRILTFDYIGSLIAAVLFPLFLVPRIGLIRTSLLFGFLNGCVGLYGTYLMRPLIDRVTGLRVRAIAVMAMLVVAFVNAKSLTALSEQELFADDVVYATSSPYQRTALSPRPTGFLVCLRRHVLAGGAVAVHCTSPLFARRSYWCIIRTVGAAGLVVRPYQTTVPSFGVWGFALAQLHPFPAPARVSLPMRYLDTPTLASMFVISPDMAPVPVEINRLDNQMLVRYYEEEWKKWS